MNKPFMKSTLAFAVLSTLAASVQAQNKSVEEQQPVAQSEATKLQTIVVTASGSEVNVKDAPASITVLTAEEIAKQPVKSISELLAKVPGVSGGMGLNGEGAKIKLRGLPSEYSLILVDGRRIGNSSRTAYRTDLQRQDLNWINPENIERIEVVKGPMSSLYGSDAMGGVINIITKKTAQEWGGSATINLEKPADSTEGDTLQISATASGAITDTVSARITAGRTEREADQNVKDLESSTTGMRNDTVEGSLVYRPTDNHQFELFGSYGSQTNTNPTYAPNVSDGEFWLGSAGDKNETESQRLGLAWDGTYSWGGSNLSVYQNKYDRSTTTEVDGVFSPTVQKTELTVVDAKVNLPFDFVVPHKLTVGGQFRSEELTNDRTLGIDSNGAPSIDGNDYTGDSTVAADVWALFFEDILSITPNFDVTIGGRLDKDERYDANFSPRVYGVYHFNDALTFKGGVSTAFRAPDLVQTAPGFSTGSRGKGCTSQFGTYDPVTNPTGFQSSYDANTNPFVNCYNTGNPNLEAEESTNYELGFQYDDEKYSGGLTYFHTDFDNKLVNMPVKHIPAEQINDPRYPKGVWYIAPDNAEKARIRGLEGTFAVNLTDYARWSTNATYFFESKNLDTGAALISTPELSVHSALDLQASDALALQMNLQYIGKQYTTETTDANAWAKAYTLYGVNANYTLNDNVTVRAGISNLFDESMETTDSSEDYYSIQGRTYFVGLTTHF